MACGADACFRLDKIHGVAVDVEAHVASHRRELPVLRYHKILVIYPYPYFGGNYPIVLLYNIINDCICIITGSTR